MKTKIKIPKGWRRLRKNEFVKIGDQFHGHGTHFLLARGTVGYMVGSGIACQYQPYIRKLKSKETIKRCKHCGHVLK